MAQGLIDLTGRARWRLSGADRVRYLNGQVTNDIRRLASGRAMPACVTTAKGRLCGLIFVSAAADALCLDTESELREAMSARLERYIIADDAALEDVTETTCQFHLLAPEAPRIEGADVAAASRYGAEGYDIIAPVEMREQIERAFPIIAPEAAEVLRIRDGVPKWGAELNEDTLPPEAGLDAWAIDYHKGCYIGQEVISRIKSVGHVNRKLMRLASEAPLAAGMSLLDGQAQTGTITSAARDATQGTWIALGYVKRGTTATTACAAEGGAVVPVAVAE